MSDATPTATTFRVYLKRRVRPVLVEAADIFAACDLAERRFGSRVDLVTEVRA